MTHAPARDPSAPVAAHRGRTARSHIARRVLVNFRADPDVVAAMLPRPFRPHTHDGWAIAGLCLIRLEQVRPAGVPARLGHTSENVAHRVAVEWDGPDGRRVGVFVLRRDTSSRVATVLGGRAFPGVHGHAQIHVYDARGELRISAVAADGTRLLVDAVTATVLPPSSVFRTLDDASAFFEQGSSGWSPGHRAGSLEGVQLTTPTWHVEPLHIRQVSSTVLDDTACFPAGSIELDHALAMRHLDADWRRLPPQDLAPAPAAHPPDPRPGPGLLRVQTDQVVEGLPAHDHS